MPSCNKVRSEIKPGVMPYALQLCLYLFVAGVMPYIVFAVTLLSSIATVYLITVHRPAGARKEEFVDPPSCAFWLKFWKPQHDAVNAELGAIIQHAKTLIERIERLQGRGSQS